MSLVWLVLDFLTCAPSVTYHSGTPVSLARDALLCMGRSRDGGVAYGLRRSWIVDDNGAVVLSEEASGNPGRSSGQAWVRVHYRWGGLVHQLWYSERGDVIRRDDGLTPLTPEQSAELTRLLVAEIAGNRSGRPGTPEQIELAIDAVQGYPRTATEWYWRVLVLDALFIVCVVYVVTYGVRLHIKRRPPRVARPHPAPGAPDQLP